MACSHVGSVEDDQAYKRKRRCQTRSPPGRRSAQASRSSLPPPATTKKGRAAAIVASAAVRGGQRTRTGLEEAEAPLHIVPDKSFADLASKTEPPCPPLLQCEEEASPKTLPPKAMLFPEAEEKREASKEKRKKRREASKDDISDRASDGGSARRTLSGSQGIGTLSLETCGTATSEGLASCRRPQSPVSVAEEPSGCKSVKACVWEPEAEQPEDDASKIGAEPKGDVPNMIEPPHDDEHKLIVQTKASEQAESGVVVAATSEQGPSELSSMVSMMSWGATSEEGASLPTTSDGAVEEEVASEDGSSVGGPSPDATSTSGQAPVVFDLATDRCPFVYDLAMADCETPALAAEFTAELSKVDLEHFAEPLARLGVEAARDVAYLSDKELVRMGMRLVQRRKLRALSASADGEEEVSEDEALAEDGDESAKVKAESGTDGCSSEVSTASLDF
jgi:hypothetical protein